MNNIMLTILTAAAGFLVTAVLGFLIIPRLLKLKFGQVILDIGPVWHKHKQGTPTMGGIMFILGTLAALTLGMVTAKIMDIDITGGNSTVPLVTAEMKTKLWSGILMALSFSLMGFVDDYIKVVKKRNMGLNFKQKTLMQLVISLAFLSSLFMGMGGTPYMFVPFIGSVNMGIFHWLFGICVIYGATNAVNFTDGIDGLCSSVTITTAVALGIIAAMRGLFGVSLAAAALAGACGGFLVWNRKPAKVFMGDTGSMFLGGMVVALAYALGCPLILLPVGVIYVIEALSDVIQIGYFKATKGKRIFKMAPIHHHFEKSGWGENKIVVVFTAVNLVGCIIGILVMYFGGYYLK